MYVHEQDTILLRYWVRIFNGYIWMCTWFSNILRNNTNMSVLKISAVRLYPKYRLRLPGVIPLYSSVVGTWNQTIRVYPTENHLCLILPNVRRIGNKKIIYNMMYWDWTWYRALPYSIDSVYRQKVGSEHTQYVSTIWPYKIFFFHLVYRQRTNT